MADADQALGQDMDQESAQKLMGRNGHDLLLAAVRIVFPTERNSIILEGNQSMVGDGNAVRITSKVVENMLGTAEGRLGVDNPMLVEELSKKPAKATWISKTLERAVELELVLTKELLKSGCELAAEDGAQRADGQEEAFRRGEPSAAVGCKTASRNNVMDVRMLKVLAPGMEHAKKSDVCSQVLRIVSEFEQRRCTGFIQ